MGLVLDSGIVILAERQRQMASELIAHIHALFGHIEVVIPAVAAMELIHGIWRAEAERRHVRETFIETLLASFSVRPFTLETARIAARIDAENQQRGIRIPGNDLLIGATALELDYELLTYNVRHYELIPGLKLRFLK